jgi:hypothetical protein
VCARRFGEHVERVMPLIMKFARQEDDELKEHVLQVKYFSFAISRFVSSRVPNPETRLDPHCFLEAIRIRI